MADERIDLAKKFWKFTGVPLPPYEFGKATRITNRSIDAPILVEQHYEDRIMKCLGTSPFTGGLFLGFLNRTGRNASDARRLALLLYDVVYCRNVDGPDALLESLAGIPAYKFKNAPATIERFCEWVRPFIELQRNSGNTQDFEHIIPELQKLAHVTALTKKKAGRWRDSYAAAVCALARFMQQKTGLARFPTLEKFLKETAAALGYPNKEYLQKSLREIVKYQQSKKVRNRG